jgi:hypothetical protein
MGSGNRAGQASQPEHNEHGKEENYIEKTLQRGELGELKQCFHRMTLLACVIARAINLWTRLLPPPHVLDVG